MRTWRRGGLFGACLLTVLGSAPATAEIFSTERLEVYGDFRARLETDFESQRADGTKRDDRTRARIRLRFGLDYTPNERVKLGLRLRSGSDDSQQSPHVTLLDFDDNDRGDAHLNLDRWFLEVRSERAWAWIGRKDLPFWRQDELFWDDDVTPAGLAFGYRSGDGKGKLELNGGYFALPVGMRRFSGHLGLAQAVYTAPSFTVAGGLLDIDADPDDADAAALLRGNGLRDYLTLVVNLQVRHKPWTFGLDLLHNAESYPVSEPLRDEVDGYVGSVIFNPGSGWRLEYFYASIEALAVNSSYAEDDWVRWGSVTQTRASDMKGHELRFVKDLGRGQNLVARLYAAEAITSVEDGNRFRIDYNLRF